MRLFQRAREPLQPPLPPSPAGGGGGVPALWEGLAVPVLACPFPLPPWKCVVQTVQLGLDPATRKLGVQFRWNGVGGAVTIQDVQPTLAQQQQQDNNADSFALLQVGQIVLTINGTPVQSSTHAAQLVHQSRGPCVELTVCEPPSSCCSNSGGTNNMPPFCSWVGAPLLRDAHPGIVLDATRQGCLVQIARVLPHGPWAGRIQAGDLVLAVQDTPVATVSAATHALLHQQQQLSYTVLLVVDMQAYRRSIGQELHNLMTVTRARWVDPDGKSSSSSNNCKSPVVQLAFRSRQKHKPELLVELPVQLATQQLVLSPHYLPSQKKKQSVVERVTALVGAFNERLEKRMALLEQSVGKEVWMHMVQQFAAATPTPCLPPSREHSLATEDIRTNSNGNCSNNTTGQHIQEETNREASLNLAEPHSAHNEDIPSLTDSCDSSSRLNQQALSPNRHDSESQPHHHQHDLIHYSDIFPLAAVEIEVWPLEALQTAQERRGNAASRHHTAAHNNNEARSPSSRAFTTLLPRRHRPCRRAALAA